MSARCKRKTTNKKHSRNENPNKAPNSHHLPYIACSAPFRSSADTLRLLSRFPTFWLLITAAFCCVCLCMTRSILSSCFHMSFTFSTARVKASKTCATPNEIIIGACRPTFIDRQPIRELSNYQRLSQPAISGSQSEQRVSSGRSWLWAIGGFCVSGSHPFSGQLLEPLESGNKPHGVTGRSRVHVYRLHGRSVTDGWVIRLRAIQFDGICSETCMEAVRLNLSIQGAAAGDGEGPQIGVRWKRKLPFNQ